MLKCMKILACLVHKAPFNVLPRCPKVASLYMHSRVRKCPEQCQTCSNAWKISTHSWVDINTMWFGGFKTIQIFWTITNTLSTYHLNIYLHPHYLICPNERLPWAPETKERRFLKSAGADWFLGKICLRPGILTFCKILPSTRWNKQFWRNIFWFWYIHI